jgi:hypothetical protein
LKADLHVGKRSLTDKESKRPQKAASKAEHLIVPSFVPMAGL